VDAKMFVKHIRIALLPFDGQLPEHIGFHRVFMEQIADLIESMSVPTDKVVIHRDELDRMNRNMAEKDRQTSEVYEIMKFEQERANRAVEVLKRVYQFKHRLPQELEYEITKLLKEAQS
jgi:hypothetical protein